MLSINFMIKTMIMNFTSLHKIINNNKKVSKLLKFVNLGQCFLSGTDIIIILDYFSVINFIAFQTKTIMLTSIDIFLSYF